MQILPGPNGLELSEDLEKLTGWPMLYPKYKTFSDGEHYIRFLDKIEKDVLVIQSLGYPQETHLFQLLNLAFSLKEYGAEKVTAYCPYLCYARADREVLSQEAVSAKSVLKLMESAGIDHLITLDVHNPNIFKFAQNMKTTNVFPTKSFHKYLKENKFKIQDYQIVAPDEGAKVRAKKLAEELNISYTNLVKTRDPETNEVGVEIGNAKIEKNKVILIDDIMTTGSSLVQASSILTLFGVSEINVFVTHALGTDAVDKIKEIGNGFVISSNSLANPLPRISTVYDLMDVLN